MRDFLRPQATAYAPTPFLASISELLTTISEGNFMQRYDIGTDILFNPKAAKVRFFVEEGVVYDEKKVSAQRVHILEKDEHVYSPYERLNLPPNPDLKLNTIKFQRTLLLSTSRDSAARDAIEAASDELLSTPSGHPQRARELVKTHVSDVESKSEWVKYRIVEVQSDGRITARRYNSAEQYTFRLFDHVPMWRWNAAIVVEVALCLLEAEYVIHDGLQKRLYISTDKGNSPTSLSLMSYMPNMWPRYRVETISGETALETGSYKIDEVEGDTILLENGVRLKNPERRRKTKLRCVDDQSRSKVPVWPADVFPLAKLGDSIVNELDLFRNFQKHHSKGYEPLPNEGPRDAVKRAQRDAAYIVFLMDVYNSDDTKHRDFVHFFHCVTQNRRITAVYTVIALMVSVATSVATAAGGADFLRSADTIWILPATQSLVGFFSLLFMINHHERGTSDTTKYNRTQGALDIRGQFKNRQDTILYHIWPSASKGLSSFLRLLAVTAVTTVTFTAAFLPVNAFVPHFEYGPENEGNAAIAVLLKSLRSCCILNGIFAVQGFFLVLPMLQHYVFVNWKVRRGSVLQWFDVMAMLTCATMIFVYVTVARHALRVLPETAQTMSVTGKIFRGRPTPLSTDVKEDETVLDMYDDTLLTLLLERLEKGKEGEKRYTLRLHATKSSMTVQLPWMRSAQTETPLKMAKLLKGPDGNFSVVAVTADSTVIVLRRTDATPFVREEIGTKRWPDITNAVARASGDQLKIVWTSNDGNLWIMTTPDKPGEAMSVRSLFDASVETSEPKVPVIGASAICLSPDTLRVTVGTSMGAVTCFDTSNFSRRSVSISSALAEVICVLETATNDLFIMTRNGTVFQAKVSDTLVAKEVITRQVVLPDVAAGSLATHKSGEGEKGETLMSIIRTANGKAYLSSVHLKDANDVPRQQILPDSLGPVTLRSLSRTAVVLTGERQAWKLRRVNEEDVGDDKSDNQKVRKTTVSIASLIAVMFVLLTSYATAQKLKGLDANEVSQRGVEIGLNLDGF